MSSKFRSILALEPNCEVDSNYAGLASITKLKNVVMPEIICEL